MNNSFGETRDIYLKKEKIKERKRKKGNLVKNEGRLCISYCTMNMQVFAAVVVRAGQQEGSEERGGGEEGETRRRGGGGRGRRVGPVSRHAVYVML